MPIKTVMLEDDTFIISKPRTLELAKELIRRGNKLPFDANCRADIGAGRELLSTLHQAGARLFCVGFESGDVEVINGMKKNNDDQRDAKYHEEAHRFVRMLPGFRHHGARLFYGWQLERLPRVWRRR